MAMTLRLYGPWFAGKSSALNLPRSPVPAVEPSAVSLIFFDCKFTDLSDCTLHCPDSGQVDRLGRNPLTAV